MKDLQTPFRYDFVGSFLRPQVLKDAKAAYQSGKIDEKELDRVTEEEIRKVVAKQKELGYHVITDGEFRRTLDRKSTRLNSSHRHTSRMPSSA